MSEIIHPSQISGEVIEGVIYCPDCDSRYAVVGNDIICCCDGLHDADYCDDCGHFHQDEVCRVAPCGNYRCCIND